MLVTVYCLTIPTINLQSIFTIGWTAALAWELPTEPYYKIRKAYLEAQKKLDNAGDWTFQNKTTTSKPIYKYKEVWPIKYNPVPYSTVKDLFRKPVHTKVFYMPKPVKEKQAYERWPVGNSNTLKFELPKRVGFLNDNENLEDVPHLSPVYKEMHRRTRRDLFAKIENFFAA